MSTLSSNFSKTIYKIGMEAFQRPIFYNAPIGIRFEIGGDEGVYLKKNKFNPAYVSAALNRAKTIYENLPSSPNIMRMDVYPNNGCPSQEKSIEAVIQLICKTTGISQPDEQILETYRDDEEDEDDEILTRFQLYWDLNKLSISKDILLNEIIKYDIAGVETYISNVYFVDTQNAVLFFLYDDRGADLVAANKELIRPIFERFNSWILDYDREEIEATFAK